MPRSAGLRNAQLKIATGPVDHESISGLWHISKQRLHLHTKPQKHGHPLFFGFSHQIRSKKVLALKIAILWHLSLIHKALLSGESGAPLLPLYGKSSSPNIFTGGSLHWQVVCGPGTPTTKRPTYILVETCLHSFLPSRPHLLYTLPSLFPSSYS